MSDMSVIIMEKDSESGYLTRELGSYNVGAYIDLIEKIFAVANNEKSIVNLYMTLPGEFTDMEFNAILDNYNFELYDGIVESIDEDEDGYNPTWIVKFEFLKNDDHMEDRLNKILSLHSAEIMRVLEAVKSLEGEHGN